MEAQPWQAEEGQQRYTSRTTPDVTCVTRHAQNAKPTSRCRTVAPWSTTMRRVFHPETDGVKASPHRHKRVLSHGAPADHMIGSSPHHSWPPSEGPRMSAARFVRLSGLREDLMLRRVPRTRTA